LYRERLGLSKKDDELCRRRPDGYTGRVIREPEGNGAALRGADIARVFSPLLFFVAHVVYLVAWSPDPFLKKWIEGSFTLFVSLVLCNVIRARVVAAAQAREGDAVEDDGAGHPRP
jgi:hypothetical protein